MAASNTAPTDAFAQLLEDWIEQQSAVLEQGRRFLEVYKAARGPLPVPPVVMAMASPPARPTARPVRERRHLMPQERGGIKRTEGGKYRIGRGVQSYAQAAGDFFKGREFEVWAGWEEIGPHIDGFNPKDRKQRDSWRRSLEKPSSPVTPIPDKPGWFRGPPAE